LKIENTYVAGYEQAIRAMRNPMDSWNKSDTYFGWITENIGPFIFGPKDLELAKKLVVGGSEHRKFLRLIQVWVTLDMPRYVWTEFDTYKVGVTRVSCSTMHKLGHRVLTEADFQDGAVLPETLSTLNKWGEQYRITKDYEYVKEAKKILPEGFLQRSDVCMNYEVAINMYLQRRNHRLPEWKLICAWIDTLPQMKPLLEAVCRR